MGLPLGSRYEVPGRELALHAAGSGSPAVIFVPGAGLVGLDFWQVQQQAAGVTTSVLYDRAGTGWSSPVDLPRSAEAVATELRSLLRAAGVPGPYLLAGHSLGAFYVRRYAQLFGDEVAGLLLLDPGHEDIFSYLPPEAVSMNDQMRLDADQLPDLTAEQISAARGQYAELYAAWPDELREPLIEHNLASWRTGVRETANFDTEIYAELRAAGTALPDVPLIVLTAGGRNPYWEQFASEELQTQAHKGIQAMHAAIAASVPRGEQRILADVSHQYMHIQQPAAVTQAIADLLAAVR